MPDTYVFKAPDGSSVSFVGDRPPTKDEMNAVMLREANAKTLKEPTTEEAGRSAGWKSYLDDLGGSMFESLAHPGLQRQGGDSIEGRYETKDKLHTAGDLAALALPTTLPMKRIPADVPTIGTEPIGNRAIKFGLRRTADALDLTPNIISSEAEKKVIAGLRRAGTVDNGVRPVGADLGPRVAPKQAAPEPVRQPYIPEHPEVPFSEKPLFRQEPDLPQTEAPERPGQGEVHHAPEDVRSAKIAESAKGGDDLGQLLDAIHGTTEEDATPAVIKTGNGETQPSYVDDYLKSTERPPEWHSGDKPGSPEAKNAQLLHRSEGELNAGYRAHIPGPLDDLMASILAAAKQ